MPSQGEGVPTKDLRTSARNRPALYEGKNWPGGGPFKPFFGGWRYMHRNPVARGLVKKPEQWPWSSYRSYAFGEVGAARINQWGEAKMKIPASAA